MEAYLQVGVEKDVGVRRGAGGNNRRGQPRRGGGPTWRGELRGRFSQNAGSPSRKGTCLWELEKRPTELTKDNDNHRGRRSTYKVA